MTMCFEELSSKNDLNIPAYEVKQFPAV